MVDSAVENKLCFQAAPKDQTANGLGKHFPIQDWTKDEILFLFKKMENVGEGLSETIYLTNFNAGTFAC